MFLKTFQMNSVKNRLSHLVLAGLVVLCQVACEKKEIQGPKGDPGTPGGGGNTSISSSDIFTIASSQWLPAADSSAWEVSISTPLITDEVFNKGAVRLYTRESASWWEVPNTREDLFMQFSFETGTLHLQFFDMHGGLPERPLTAQYRLVVTYAAARPVKEDTETLRLNPVPAAHL